MCLSRFGADSVVCFNLGNTLYQLGRVQGAIERYRQALEIDPRYVEAWNDLGNALADIGHREEAVDALQRALQLHPQYADAHYNLADVLDSLGRWKEAQPHGETDLQEDPQSEWAKHARRRLVRSATLADEWRLVHYGPQRLAVAG